MSEEMRRFMKDLITLLQEKYNESLGMAERASEQQQAAFDRGASFAYYDTLDLIRSQMTSFGYDVDPKIVPEFGKPVAKPE